MVSGIKGVETPSLLFPASRVLSQGSSRAPSLSLPSISTAFWMQKDGSILLPALVWSWQKELGICDTMDLGPNPSSAAYWSCCSG